MNVKRKVIAAAVGAAISPVVLVALPSATASAHGYVNSPPSRQAQCAKGTVPCGAIKYEPQSVEGPKGLRNCHGNNAAFAELSDDSKPWKPTAVGRTVTFNWTFTARHRTSNYEYFLGGQRIAVFDGGNAQPPANVSHQVNLGNATGRQKVLAIWNIADTANAFYACVDLQVS
ncbi:lytic polysaccharide monooxygenase auxiliary activity family 9 protein [Amycolatopsis anabasis]|uniref:lytic polysaccharide monooxygenase auxiliary activity family 9 protein n=1 Tax=Amycolatopsis anabasis TaxID=1840409 RepID=UPI00131C3A3D|nr:lytic polysaccharide monooxygenase auxiliary activity family 9 protein [Amycolatopsis anabasis]